jgi:hypothetical protein
MKSLPARCLTGFITLLAIALNGLAAPAPLPDQFRTPPAESRPWCFWYWVNNNISREGITRDLEAMKSAGIGTGIIANVYLDDMPDGPVPVLSEQWWELTAHAVREARRLGLDIGLFNCTGWSQSGGPWIKSTETMRFLTWSETRVAGGRKFSGVLPAPREAFQDVAVLALPVPPEDEAVLSKLHPRVEAANSADPATRLADGDLGTGARFPADHQPWTVTLAVDAPFTARSLTLYPTQADFLLKAELQALQADGRFRTVRSFAFDRSNNRREVGPVPYAPLTISFEAVTSPQWRLVLSDLVTQDPKAGLAEIELSGAARVERIMEKQLAKLHPTPKPMGDAYVWPDQAEPGAPGFAADPGSVIDLTKQMKPGGHVEWTAPAGQWVILRMGMSPTGITNHPSAANAKGPEVDKMSKAAMRHHFASFVQPLLDRLSTDDKKAFKYVAADSYETGSQNWTDDNAAYFRKNFGYDPTPWLPVLTGRIVGTADQSNRFLWDLRRLVADRVAHDYAAALTEESHKAGMQSWLQNYGHWGFPGEFLQYGGQADLLSGEFWAGRELGDIECRAASSASHIYGKNITYGEAFTSDRFYEFHPYALKARGDWAFSEGINHLVLQTFIQQPDETRTPGVNAWFGTEFNRKNTWFGPGRAWIDYLRRCHVMLQQGRNIADVAYFIGEDTPKMTGTRDPELPAGHSFDYLNAEVLENRLRVKDGRFVLPDGTSYGLIVFPESKAMRPAVLTKVRDLVNAGGRILGTAPTHSPSLQDHPAADQRVKELAGEFWTDGAKPGGGRVFVSRDLAGALAQLGIAPDVSSYDPKKLLWVHRSTPEREIYFVSNQTDESLALSPVFRVSGRAPELWDAAAGTVEASARHAGSGAGTRVDFTLNPRGSVFVVFPAQSGTNLPDVVAVTRENQPAPEVTVVREENSLVARVEANGRYLFTSSSGKSSGATMADLPAPHALAGPWRLIFPPHRDVPAEITLPTLTSWTDQANEAIRHFSGTATYEHTVSLRPEWFGPGRRQFLELGRLEVIAEVTVNGQPLGVAWLPPYRVDVTGVLHTGDNHVSIRVTNLWRNRLLGDRKYPEGYPGGPKPKEFQSEVTSTASLKLDDPLQPSGLLGPVRVLVRQDLPVVLR